MRVASLPALRSARFGVLGRGRRRTEAIAVLDTHPDAIMVKDLGFDGGEPEAAEAPENPKEFCPIDVFDDQPWTTPFFPKPEMNEWEDEVRYYRYWGPLSIWRLVKTSGLLALSLVGRAREGWVPSCGHGCDPDR